LYSFFIFVTFFKKGRHTHGQKYQKVAFYRDFLGQLCFLRGGARTIGANVRAISGRDAEPEQAKEPSRNECSGSTLLVRK
jgi:hypothetical protein